MSEEKEYTRTDVVQITKNFLSVVEAGAAKLQKLLLDIQAENAALKKRVAYLEECTNWDIENALAEADDYKRKCDALEEKVKEFEKLKSEAGE